VRVQRACFVAALFVVAACGEFDVDDSTQALSPDGRYIVVFAPGGSADQIRGVGGQVLLDLPAHSAAAAQLPDAAVSALRDHPRIALVEVDHRRYPLAQKAPYGIAMVQADQVSDGSAGNRTVCIIDSGYSLDHEDLSSGSNVTGTSDSGTGDWFVDNSAHGTHVAGTVSALNNGVGVVGVLPNSNINLHIVKVFGDDGTWTYSSSLVHALDVCRANGANVVSMSLGSSFKSTTEDAAFADAFNNGVLSVAAAGNDGNTRHNYPASYDSVISVAAIDENMEVAVFSQQTNQVELAAPGVSVRSTVPMGTGSSTTLTVGGADVDALGMDGSPFASGTGPLVDCGLGDSVCTAASGGVCLIQRGNISFAEKVQNCEAGGGVAAVIYNNEPGALLGTLGDAVTSIPSAGISDTDGAALLGQLGASTTLTLAIDNYAYFDGTSMATPHVSGVAALVWSYDTSLTNVQIRDALRASALDLGTTGRDDAYGYGLVQAKAALDLLGGGGCTPTESPETSCSDGVDNDCDGLTDADDPDCAPSCTITEDPEVSCGDGVDNDCDGLTDADDPDCAPSCTITEDPEVSCGDGVDNDCDGLTDADDPDCGGAECLPAGSSCGSDAECCSGKCRGRPGRQDCKG
jgi:subtilisin family serine protease